MRVVWTVVRLHLGPLLLTFKYQFYGIIAVIVLLICVCLSRVGSKDLREVAVAVEIVFSIATVGAAISLPFAITRNIQISGTYYCGQELLFDEDVIAWLHQCRRNWILSEVKRMRVHLELEYIKSNCFTKNY